MIAAMDDTLPTGSTETDAQYRERLAWEAERIAKALASVEREGTIPFEEVEAWVESWGTPNELPTPKPRKSSQSQHRL